MNFEISEGLLAQIQNYLIERPYKEVFPLMQALVSEMHEQVKKAREGEADGRSDV